MDAAAYLVEWACRIEEIEPGQLVLHADNGGPMKGSTMLAMFLPLFEMWLAPLLWGSHFRANVECAREQESQFVGRAHLRIFICL